MKKYIHVRLLLSLLIFCMFILHPMAGLCKKSTEIIQVEFRKASELLPLFQGMLSDDGKASVDARTNSIVVTDEQERIDRIKSLIKRFDVAPQQARIRVKFQGDLLSGAGSIRGRGSISTDSYEINIGKGKKNGTGVNISAGTVRKNEMSEYFINVLSGSPAYILAGEKIVFSERWNYLLQKYARYNEPITIQSIETGFDVKPVITGDYAVIEITPRISHREHGARKKIIRFTEAATTVSAPLNQWVTIGGTDKNSNEVIREILGYETSNNSTSLSISLMVEK
ncbi:MAG: secretin N-terminal domain-containing protein [Desulfobacteraceae bacterium]